MKEKCHVARKNPLRAPALIRKYPLTGGAEASAGRQTGSSRKADAPKRNKHREIEQAGAPKEEVGAHVGFVSPLFDIAGD
jgi:hypothetical protein